MREGESLFVSVVYGMSIVNDFVILDEYREWERKRGAWREPVHLDFERGSLLPYFLTVVCLVSVTLIILREMERDREKAVEGESLLSISVHGALGYCTST